MSIIITTGGLVAAGISWLIYQKWFRTTNVAKNYVGIKELTGNSGFIDSAFQQQMASVGWKTGEAWCVFFAKLVWIQTKPLYRNELETLINGNVDVTYNNFLNDTSGHYEISDTPTKGAIVLWLGHHAGIVWKVDTSAQTFQTIEGNYEDQIEEVNHQYDEANMVFIKIK